MENDETYTERIKNIQGFGDLFDLQLSIDQHFKNNGGKAAIAITDQIVEAVKSSSREIPFIKELFKIIFDHLKSDDEIKRAVLNKINGYLLNQDKYIRYIAIEILSEYRYRKTAPALIVIAGNETEEDDIRMLSLKCLKKKKLSEIIEFSLLLEILRQKNEKIVSEAMNVLEYHKDKVPFKETQNVLEQIFRSSENIFLRCRAVELLGIFGEMDIIERICILPLTDKNIIDSVHKMVQHIISKPRNILYIRPDSFEYLISQLLIKLDYEQVKVTQPVKDDGIDIVAYKRGGVKNEKYKTVVQCKRYAKDKIGVEVLEQLIEKLEKYGAKEGQLITTSYFSKETEILAKERCYIELIDRDNLQLLLDKKFGKNLYCIVNRN